MKRIKLKDISRNWHLIDAKNKVLGRLSSDVAKILMGKNKNYYTPYLDVGDFVVLTNAKDIILSGKKNTQKKYYHHSGYPGGLRVSLASQVMKRSPELILRNSIKGMMPKTKLGKLMMKKLFIYSGDDHAHKSKFK